MRTTVEISDDQHRALEALARRRGLRGFSALVREAVDQYLSGQSGDDLDLVLTLRGSLTEDEEAGLRQAIEEAWGTWRSSPSSSTPTF